MAQSSDKPRPPGHKAAKRDQTKHKPRPPRRYSTRFDKGHGKRGGSAGGRTGR